jgi:hypothetical protein
MLHPSSVVASIIALAVVQGAGVPTARAESARDETSPAPSFAAEATPPKRAGFELLANAGYGASTAPVGNVELAPYGASLGLDVGYVFRFGFRVGVSVGYGFGRTVSQRREPTFGDPYDYDIDTSSLNLATSLGYDVPLSFLVLRYTVGLGATFMRWDVDGALPEDIFGQIPAQSPSAGFLVAPGLTLLWPHDALECGVGFDYFVQANWAIPPGFLGKLVIGVKL